MNPDDPEQPELTPDQMSRRDAIKGLFAACATLTATGCQITESSMAPHLKKDFRRMSTSETNAMLKRWETKYSKKFDQKVSVGASPAEKGVLFGYALDIARCIGCRRCVYACVDENNQSRDPEVHWISVLEMDKSEGVNLHHADQYYEREEVPHPGKFYFPVACQQCEKPPCTKVCPVGATWKEPDGIVVVDYDWCIGCRCCVTACPYGARHFNWGEPKLPKEELNPDTHYLGNRPRPRGVVEKCTFCIQRVRKGRYPACVEVCPVGARKFGNLLDPNSEIRYILDHKRVYILKEELGTEPKFFYYFGV